MVQKPLSILFAGFHWLKPPEPTDNGELKGADAVFTAQTHAKRERHWRWRMFWTVSAIVVLVVSDQLLQWGALPRLGMGVGFGGYAWASDVDRKVQAAVKPIQDDITSIKDTLQKQDEADRAREIEALKQQIFETKIAQCTAKASESGSNPYAKRLSDLMEKYTELTGRAYPVPACEDL